MHLLRDAAPPVRRREFGGGAPCPWVGSRQLQAQRKHVCPGRDSVGVSSPPSRPTACGHKSQADEGPQPRNELSQPDETPRSLPFHVETDAGVVIIRSATSAGGRPWRRRADVALAVNLIALMIR